MSVFCSRHFFWRLDGDFLDKLVLLAETPAMPKVKKKPAKVKRAAKPRVKKKVQKRATPKSAKPRAKKKTMQGTKRARFKTVMIDAGDANLCSEGSPRKRGGGDKLAAGPATIRRGFETGSQTEFEAHNLPFEYGHNQVVLLIVDPTFIFTYWEVEQSTMHDALQKLGPNAKLALRFYELDGSASSNVSRALRQWDVSVYERVGTWYLKLDRPDQNLSVDVGMKNDRGEFFCIARSRSMHLPALGLAAPHQITWMVVDPISGRKVMSEIEAYTEADVELLKRIMGPHFFNLFRQGQLSGLPGSNLEHVFLNVSSTIPEVRPA